MILGDRENNLSHQISRLVRNCLESAIISRTNPLETQLRSQVVEIVRECQEELFTLSTKAVITHHLPRSAYQQTPTESLAETRLTFELTKAQHNRETPEGRGETRCIILMIFQIAPTQMEWPFCTLHNTPRACYTLRFGTFEQLRRNLCRPWRIQLLNATDILRCPFVTSLLNLLRLMRKRRAL
ncbi:uncharacterized protein BCR38DRAFT_153110 [Pseudomassariella vexata]|uniref:Uncharacterized protein n=1 Tax=Pseudomassariella vexata TaxID=1141098 RepID=A0A1Y2E6N8_9PEZI|nr:uncharacterized protein BCR38DRAFT_153110 [Pseudomassariella vexata]ORY67221.1 hypothetical protein BCR38DRAFT_153110 [Pseudomassariella vexata]